MSANLDADLAALSGAEDPKVSIIRSLEAAGFALIPLNGKKPVMTDWETTPVGAFTAANILGNYGVVLKADDIVVDVDPRNFKPGDKPLARLVEAVKGLPPTFTVRSGGDSAGLHLYFKKPADTLTRSKLKDYQGIDFRSAGLQMVGPGSVHPTTGKVYEVVAGSPSAIAPAPAALLELLRRTEIPFDELNKGTGAYVNDAATQGRYADYLQHTAPATGSFAVACVGRDMGLPPAVTWELMADLWNPRRPVPRTPEELRVKVVHAYTYATGRVGASHPAADFDKVINEATSAAKKEPEPELSWDLTPQGQVKKTFQNLLNYLRLPAGGLHRVFAFNEFTGREEFANPAPWHKGRVVPGRMVTEADLRLLKGLLATRHKFDASIQSIEEAVTNVAHYDRFHPVQEFLDGLKWDGVPRLDTWLKDYLGAVDDGNPEYLTAVSRKVLCAAVARIYKPGIKFDHVLVLEGPQDLGKSTAIEILGGEWASDAPVDPHNRDTVDAMIGRWVIEMPEMEVLRRTDEEALKAFITRRTDRVRLAYGRRTGEFPRQSIFIASKNPRSDGTYLRDETGGRRWWPVRCAPRANANGVAQADFKGLKAVRAQLFAEARIKWLNGEALYMETAALKQQAKDVVEHRHAPHEWTERIAAWIAETDLKPETRRDFLTARDVFVDAGFGGDRALDRKAERGIASALRACGWESGHYKRVGGIMVRGYKRASTEVEPLDNLVALL